MLTATLIGYYIIVIIVIITMALSCNSIRVNGKLTDKKLKKLVTSIPNVKKYGKNSEFILLLNREFSLHYIPAKKEYLIYKNYNNVYKTNIIEILLKVWNQSITYGSIKRNISKLK